MVNFSRILLDLLASRRVAVLFLALALTFTIYSRYGGGKPLPAIEAEFSPFNRPPDLVAQLDAPLRRIAVGMDGTIYGVVHPKFQTDIQKIVQIDSTGRVRPFPDEDWQRVEFQRPTAISVDRRGLVWIAEDHPLGLFEPRVLAIDPGLKKIVASRTIDRSILPRGSSLGDLALTRDGMHVALSDSSALRLSARLIHWDLEDNSLTASLIQHSSVRATRAKAVVDGDTLGTAFDLKVHREGVNALAFTADGASLTYASAANPGLFALPTDDFLQSRQGVDPPLGKIAKLSDKPWTEDIATDMAGNIYLAAAARGQVLRLSPDGGLTAIVPPSTFVWPSGLAFGPGGGLYVSETALNQVRWRGGLADVLENAPLGLGRLPARWIRGTSRAVGQLGIWRLDVGMAGVMG